jgi:outer membrane protein TolC
MSLLSNRITGTCAGSLVAALLLLCLGCNPDTYVRKADSESYRIVAEKQVEVLGATKEFSIDRNMEDPLSRMRKTDMIRNATGIWQVAKPVPVAASAALVSGSVTTMVLLPLEDALGLGVLNSREYLRRKEDLYITALSLTSERHNFENRYFWNLGTDANRDGDNNRSVSGSSSSGLNRSLRAGGSLALNLATSFLHYFKGDYSNSSSSIIGLDFFQPLLRGSGYKIAQESLTQAERNVIYQVRSFSRYQKNFAINLADDYYRVLQEQDKVANEWKSYLDFQDSRVRTEMEQQAGKRSKLDVYRFEQEELRAKNRWIDAREQYELLMDRFKITLGLPVDTPVILDNKELDRLREAGLINVEIESAQAVEIALKERLDLATSRDQYEDVKRQVAIARDNLRSDLDLSVGVDVPSQSNSPADLQLGRTSISGGLDLDLPLERTSERNSYRRALINLERERRSLDEETDNIKLAVRSDCRELNQARESYQIQKKSVEVANSRLESANMQLQAGRSEPREVTDARNDLVSAENNLTKALIDYTIARLGLFANIELLEVNEKGMWTHE